MLNFKLISFNIKTVTEKESIDSLLNSLEELHKPKSTEELIASLKTVDGITSLQDYNKIDEVALASLADRFKKWGMPVTKNHLIKLIENRKELKAYLEEINPNQKSRILRKNAEEVRQRCLSYRESLHKLLPTERFTKLNIVIPEEPNTGGLDEDAMAEIMRRYRSKLESIAYGLSMILREEMGYGLYLR